LCRILQGEGEAPTEDHPLSPPDSLGDAFSLLRRDGDLPVIEGIDRIGGGGFREPVFRVVPTVENRYFKEIRGEEMIDHILF